ncbi:MAG: hypothetical protein JWM59_48 [Verrucomicrobiales bacterium]|nr:hypothetical protein [Verrucomicrobiales bacterium]
MSVLSTPRITFRGEISWDPIVTNNQPTSYDESTGNIVPAADPADAFRASAIDQVTTGGNWNPHGTHRSTFYNAYITEVDLGAGNVPGDPFIGVPVAFSGMLVDLEPYGATTSQLFFDEMSFGIQGGCSILAQRAYRFTDRNLNFARNNANAMIAGVAGITWQSCFPTASLALAAFDSPVLQALKDALQAPGALGLMVRWQAYRTVYFDDPALSNGTAGPAGQALQDKLKTGGWQPNPARSLLVGTIGVWHADDPIHEPGDRALVPQGVTFAGGSQFGPAFALLGDSSLTLDLGAFVPERDRATNKYDVGTLSVIAVNPKNPNRVLATLGTIPYAAYDKAAYEANAGIITLTGISAQDIAIAQKADLQICDGHGVILAAETSLRAISADPNLYLDEGSTAPSSVRVYDRGVPVGAGIAVQLSAFSSDAQGNPVAQPVGQPQTTDSTGTVSFQFAAQAPGVVQYGFGLASAPPPASLDSTTVTFMSVRILPADADIAVMSPTWDNVYKYVLSNWYAMAPCMDNWLLLNNAAMVTRYGPMVQKLTAPDYFEAFRFMPVTRDLSAGKRTLLHNYLNGTTTPQNPHAIAAVHSPVEGNLIKIIPSLYLRPANQPSKSKQV